MLDRSLVGWVSEPRVIEVEKGALRFFAKATGETDAVYFDEYAALAAGHRTLPAPPTYLFTLALLASRQNSLDEMGIDLRSILHGEQSFVYERQIYAGDVVTLRTRISEIYTRKNGALEFLVETTSAVDGDDRPFGEMRNVLVIKYG
jgi:hypothetical protein